MFCPQCGSTQPDELRFCKSCGANLDALRRVLATREQDDSFDWSKTWVADMFMSSEESVRRAAELDRLRGRTPEVKRRNEIKAGVITGSAGLGLMILLFVLMGGIIASGRVPDSEVEILSRIWIVGVIPLLIGAALVFNGLFVSKKTDEPPAGETATDAKGIAGKTGADLLMPADTTELIPTQFSVTDETTKHLKEPRRKPDSLTDRPPSPK
ncbi:MAG: hypothetical protein AB7F88_12040 [Pyrinomonadaceae bacterium]